MIDIRLRVHETGESHGPFESWADVIHTIHELSAAGAKEIAVVRDDFVCDFCSDPHPAWDFPADDAFMAVVGRDVHMSHGDWAACEQCHALIVAEDWNGLFDRSKGEWQARYGDHLPFGIVSKFIEQAHATFRRARTDAPPTRIPTDEELLG